MKNIFKLVLISSCFLFGYNQHAISQDLNIENEEIRNIECNMQYFHYDIAVTGVLYDRKTGEVMVYGHISIKETEEILGGVRYEFRRYDGDIVARFDAGISPYYFGCCIPAGAVIEGEMCTVHAYDCRGDEIALAPFTIPVYTN